MGFTKWVRSIRQSYLFIVLIKTDIERRIPPIDTNAPSQSETATIALG